MLALTPRHDAARVPPGDETHPALQRPTASAIRIPKTQRLGVLVEQVVENVLNQVVAVARPRVTSPVAEHGRDRVLHRRIQLDAQPTHCTGISGERRREVIAAGIGGAHCCERRGASGDGLVEPNSRSNSPESRPV